MWREYVLPETTRVHQLLPKYCRPTTMPMGPHNTDTAETERYNNKRNGTNRLLAGQPFVWRTSQKGNERCDDCLTSAFAYLQLSFAPWCCPASYQRMWMPRMGMDGSILLVEMIGMESRSMESVASSGHRQEGSKLTLMVTNIVPPFTSESLSKRKIHSNVLISIWN